MKLRLVLIFTFILASSLIAQSKRVLAPSTADMKAKQSKFPYTLSVAFPSKMENGIGSLTLSLRTTKIFNNGGYKINLKSREIEGGIEIEILSVSAPRGIATMALRPASGKTRFQVKQGDLRIIIKDKSTTDVYNLSVDGSNISLIAEEDTSLFEKRSFQYSVPPLNAFRMLISYKSKMSKADLTQEILDRVHALPGVKQWDPDKHGYPSSIKLVHGEVDYHYFTMKDISINKLKALANDYKANKQMFISFFILSEKKVATNR